MMTSQLEFEKLLAGLKCLPPQAKLPKVRPGLNATNYTIALARALKAENLSHALFNILTCIGRAQVDRGFATTAQISIDLGVTFNSVHIQIHKSPQLFSINKDKHRSERGTVMNRITLTDEAIALLVTVKKRAKRYATAKH